jgi:ABC-type spermidine/putrescine transport system, permease component I
LPGGPAAAHRLFLAAPLGEGAVAARAAAHRLRAVYLARSDALFVSSFWSVDPFTTEIVHVWSLDNYRTIFESSAYRTIALRTIGIAAAVTIADALIAFPLAYFMARLASARTRTFLFVAVLLPLWSSYLIRVYIWRSSSAMTGCSTGCSRVLVFRRRTSATPTGPSG